MHVFIYLGVGCKISVDISGGFLSCDPDILSKRKRAYSVDYAEIDRLCARTHCGSDAFDRHAKDLTCGKGMNVDPVFKGVYHVAVVGYVRQDAQLYLRIVGIAQHISGFSSEKFAHLAPLGSADGNVLKVGFSGGQPPGSGLGLIKG